MKQKVHFLFLLFMALAIHHTAKAYDFSAVAPSGQTLYYSILDNNYGAKMVKLVHPAPNFVYAYISGSLILPDSVQYNGVKYVVTDIESNAFEGCSGLTSISIPKTINTIQGNPFQDCSNLNNIDVDPLNTNYDSRNNCNAIIDSRNNNLLVGCNNTVIPNTVVKIGGNSFYNRTRLNSIIIPNSVNEIGGDAFYGCSGLDTVIIGNGVTIIGNRAFFGCSNIELLSIGNSVQIIGNYVFGHCVSLDTVIIPNSVNYIGDYAFSGCTDLSQITIPDAVVSIGNGAFSGCINLSSITIPDAVVSIGNSAFSGCINLSSITIPDGVVSINNGTFSNCNNLSSIIIGNGITNIGEYAFWNCTSLVSVIIPSQVSNVGDGAFYGCTNLNSIVFKPSNPPTVGSNCFYSDYYGYHIKIIVPCGRISAYRNAWTEYNRCHFSEPDADVSFLLNSFPNDYGMATIIQQNGHDILCSDSSVIISASEYIGYHFDHWSNGETARTDTLFLKGDSIVTAYFGKNKYFINVITNDSAMGYAMGSDTVEYLDTIIISAVSKYGYHFKEWDYENIGHIHYGQLLLFDNTFSSNYLVAYDNTTIAAVFDYNKYNIALSVDSALHGFVSGDGYFNYLTESNISAMPHYGYHFAMWNDSVTDNPRTIILTQDTSFSALFEKNIFFVNVISEDTNIGLTTGSDSITYLDSISIDATSLYGYHFSQWSDGDTNNPRTIQVTRDSIFTALFAKNNYSITLNVDTLIHGSVTGAGTYEYLDNKTISATPNYGYHFIQWSDGSTDNPRIITLTKDTSFTALYDNNIYDISTTSEDAVMGTTLGDDSIAYLDSVIISATANYGYHFTRWSDGDTNNPRTIQVTRDSIFTAQFAKNNYSITLNVDTLIHGSVTGAGTYEYLDNKTISATPNYGYHFTQWSDGSTDNPRIIILTKDTSFTALYDNNLYVVNTISEDTVMGTTLADDSIAYLDSVVISATANYGYHFTRWSDGDTNNPRTIQVTRDSTFTAQFAKNNYSITLNVDTLIHGSVTGAGTYEYLDNKTISATPNYGYHFTQWSDGSTDNPRTIILTQDTNFTALYGKNNYYVEVITANGNMGNVLGSDTVQYLDTITIMAVPQYGYHFTQWSDGDINNPRQIQVTKDSVFTALFDYNHYSISLDVDTSIHGMVNGGGTYNYLTINTINATANYGYHFSQWNDGDTTNPRSITLTQDTSFTAFFAKNNYSVTVHCNDSTLGEVFGSIVSEYLDTVNISANVIMPHHHFVRWSDGGIESTRNIVITKDTVLTAYFAIDTHTVSLTENDNRYGTVSGAGSVPYGNSVIIEAIANDGYHFAEWSNGSRNNPDSITVLNDTLITAIFTDDVVTQICMVSVENNRNVVVWNKELEVLNYNIYRESNIAGEYDLIKTVPFESNPEWIDTASRPSTRSYRYYMTATDVYGIESDAGDIHKTMHLTISQGIGGRWNLVWTEYEGADYSTYIIYRGTNASDIQQVDVLPAGGNTTYTDETAPEGAVYYQVGIVPTEACALSKNSNAILSNIATNGIVGVPEVYLEECNISVENGVINIETPNNVPVTIYDQLGRLMYSNRTRNNNHTFSVPVSGLYHIKIGNNSSKKIIVIK